MTLQVGFPGEQRNTSFVSGSMEPSSSGKSTSNSGVRGADLISTSLIFAHTLYMPYVGGVISALSALGLQNILNSMSIASSLPTPKKICSF